MAPFPFICVQQWEPEWIKIKWAKSNFLKKDCSLRFCLEPEAEEPKHSKKKE